MAAAVGTVIKLLTATAMNATNDGMLAKMRLNRKARLFIFKMRTNFGHLNIWDQFWAHLARVEAIEHAAA